jgi:glycosyltransferase involved in cell wall biosynthesis
LKKILYIGNKLSQHGLSVTSIETLGELLSSEGYSIYFASTRMNKVARLTDMIWKTLQLRNNVDYILIDTYSTSNFWYAFVVSQLARFFKVPYIPILRGGDLPRRLINSPRLSALIFENAYKNVAPSNYLYTAFLEKGFNNVLLLPNTIELKHYIFKERTFFYPKLLWVRALQDIYNPKMAIDVLRLVQKKYPEATLCMVGGEKNISIATMQEYAKEKGVFVTFTGRLPKPEWLALAANYDIFLNTTHFDNTPVSVMEAMALGLPVISTNVGGIPYLLEQDETGIMTPDNDASKMAQAIISLLDNPKKAHEMALKARAVAIIFDWDVVKKQWRELFQ